VVRRIFADWGPDVLDTLDFTLSVNFPLNVLLVPEASNWLECMRQQAGIPATRLTIELTESQPLSRLTELAAAAHRLRDIGYGLAIDDVGPDIRDHGALLALPFTMLKLDKDVVRAAAVTPAAGIFLAGAVAAAHDAGLVVTAEGVEDEACWGRMNALGVEFVQGFLVGRPLSADAMLGWHRKWNISYPR
jgi:EAL domain-containing protein (putative c-di-GMP-specific phosphodiesterase class I)